VLFWRERIVSRSLFRVTRPPFFPLVYASRVLASQRRLDCTSSVRTEAASCEIHHLDRDGQPTAADFEREAKHLFGNVIPAGQTVTIYRWREKKDGEDFHARYLLTNKGGMRVEPGFSAEGGHQTADMALLDFDFSQAIRRTLSRDANVYELVEPVLQIAPTGYVDHV
jgi:hypothetical protein